MPVGANGVLSLQMVDDVGLCCLNTRPPLSVTQATFKVLLLFIDQSIDRVCGKLRATLYPHGELDASQETQGLTPGPQGRKPTFQYIT